MEIIENPKRLFKYASSDIAKIILRTSCIKFSPPNDFNDPFDCDIDLVDFHFPSDQQLDKEVAYEIEVLKKQFKNWPGFSDKSKDKSFWERGYKESQIGKIKSCGISCFSLVNNAVLMWSHYAEKHFGICLEFDNTISPRFENLSDETDISEGIVGYSKYERINYMSTERKYAIFKIFLSKSGSWSHENEYRMILLNDKPQIQKFKHQFLKAIYFGLRTSDREQNEIISMCTILGFVDIGFFKCTKSDLSIRFSKITV